MPLIRGLISGIRLSAALRLFQAPGCSKCDARGANSQGSQHGLQALGAFLARFGAASSPSSSSSSAPADSSSPSNSSGANRLFYTF